MRKVMLVGLGLLIALLTLPLSAMGEEVTASQETVRVVVQEEGRRTGGYLIVEAGGTWLDDEDTGPGSNISFDTGALVGAGIGADAGIIRLELAFHYRQFDIDEISLGGLSHSGNGEIQMVSGLINAWLDLENSSIFTPYAGGGAGYSWVEANDFQDIDGNRFEDEDTGIGVWQVGAGVAIEVSENALLDLGYRFFATEDVELQIPGGAQIDIEPESHVAQLGLRLMF